MANPSSTDWENAGRFVTIEECMDWVESYARSAREAAYRQERLGTEMYLTQLREMLVEAIKAYKELQ